MFGESEQFAGFHLSPEMDEDIKQDGDRNELVVHGSERCWSSHLIDQVVQSCQLVKVDFCCGSSKINNTWDC